MWGGGRGSKIVMISFFLNFAFVIFFLLLVFVFVQRWNGLEEIKFAQSLITFSLTSKRLFFCLMLFFVFPYSELTQISLEGSIPFYHHITCVYISLAMDFYRGGNKLQKNIILQSPKNKKNMFFIQSKSTCLRS